MNYFHPVTKAMKSKLKIFSASILYRSISGYSEKSIVELNRYIYFDNNRLRNEKFQNNIRYRYPGIEEINFPRLREYLKIYRKHCTYKENLTRTLKEVRDEMNKLKGIMKKPNADITKRIATCSNRIAYLNSQVNVVVEYCKQLRRLVIIEYMSVPNDLHQETPKGDDELLIYSKKIPFSSPSNHLTVGKNIKVLNYFNSSFYFLLNDAALLEFATMNFFMKNFQNEKFIPFVNPDTCNDFIVNGTSDEKSEKFFKLENGEFSLVGGSSFSSFCAVRIGHSVHMKYLPERNVTYGRHYTPQTKHGTEDGLYSVFQRSNVHLFVAVSCQEQMNEEFQKTLQHLKHLYETLDVEFRIIYQPASTLLLGESLRASIQLYSAYMKKYIEIAHLSLYDDFVSKRLLMLCHNKDSKYKYLHLIEGVAVSYPTLLAYLLERSNDKELYIPECLRSFMYHKS